MTRFFILKEKTCLEAYSSGEKNGQPALLFLHGAGAHPIQFEKQLKFFSHNFFTLSIGLHAHSNNFKDKKYAPEEFTLSKMAEDILFTLNQIGVNRVHLIGNSAGGLTGYEMIKKAPEKVLSLVTFGTCPRLTYPFWMVKLISRTDKLMLQRRPEKYLRFAAKQSTPNSAVIEKIVTIMMESKHVAHLIRANIGNYDYLDLLTNLTIPYLIIKGRYDNSINKCLKKSQNVFRTNKNIQIVDFDRSGHFANLDEADLFNRTISDFVNSIDATSRSNGAQ